MLCPKCSNTPLKSGNITGRQLNLDQCPVCKGIWFDKGEFATLLAEKAEKDFVVPEFAGKMPDVICPRCSVSLYEFCYPGTLTLIDGCKKCTGIWLDNKEWKAISHARDESNNINCPRCHMRQKPAESCAKCGTVFAKYQPVGTDRNSNSNYKTTNISDADEKEEKSYADGIPGVKGSLLRMIDDAIKRLKSNIF